MSSNGVPSVAVASSVLVLIYSAICLSGSTLLFYLLWKANSRFNYVSLVALYTSIGTFFSIVQQLHFAVAWRTIMTDRFNAREQLNSQTSSSIIGTELGLDLVLFWIQFYTYSVEALLIVFWAFQLLKGMSETRSQTSRFHSFSPEQIEMASKVFAIIFPGLLLGIIQIDAIKSNIFAFVILCDLSLVVSLIAGSIALATTLYKFVKARGVFSSSVSSGGGSTGARGQQGNLISTRRKSDRWLIIRFTIAFVLLAVFELCVILYQVLAYQSNQRHTLDTTPEYSTATAIPEIMLFIPAVTTSLFAYLVWGTTSDFLQETKRLLCCGRIRTENTFEKPKPKPRKTFKRLSSIQDRIHVVTEMNVLTKGNVKGHDTANDKEYSVNVWTNTVASKNGSRSYFSEV